MLKERRMGGAPTEHPGHQPLLDVPVVPAAQQVFGGRAAAQRLTSFGIIDRSAIIRIDQAEIPELGALVEVRYAGYRQAQQRLGQTVQRACWRQALSCIGNRRAQTPEAVVEQQTGEKVAAGCFVFRGRGAPAADQLCLAQGLFLPACHAPMEGLQAFDVIALQIQGPAGQQGLVEHQFVSRRGRADLAHRPTQRCRQLLPVAHTVDIPGCPFADNGQPRARILAALVVMGGGSEQIARVKLATPDIGFVEGHRWRLEVFRIKAHIIA